MSHAYSGIINDFVAVVCQILELCVCFCVWIGKCLVCVCVCVRMCVCIYVCDMCVSVHVCLWESDQWPGQLCFHSLQSILLLPQLLFCEV